MLTIRQKKIIRLLEDNSGSASIDEMLNHLYISKSTLRRDLINLEKLVWFNVFMVVSA